MQDGPLQRYRPMVFKGELAPDTAQELAAEKLQLLANRLAQYSEPRLGDLLPFVRRRRSAAEGALPQWRGRTRQDPAARSVLRVHSLRTERCVHFQEFMVERMRRSIWAAKPQPIRF
jgi:predicted ATPase